MATPTSHRIDERGKNMKVSIFKLPDGSMDVLVEASVGSGKPPVLLQGVTEDDVVSRVRPVVDAQKGRRLPGDSLPV